MNYRASRVERIKPSASAWVSQAAKAAQAAGQDVIDLGLGEPNFDTPSHISLAAHQAALAGDTKYPPTIGTQSLREAIIAKLERENRLLYSLDEVIVSNGAKQVIFNALMATLEPNDEVILLAPYFGQYKDMVEVLGGKVVVVECPAENGFKCNVQQLNEALTSNTRWVFLNQPSNPSGAVYSSDELQKLGAVLEPHPRALVLSDEIYEHILFDNAVFNSFAHLCPLMKDRTLTVNGVSKAYAMTGWRIGYGAGHGDLIDAMVKVQSQISSGACTIAQAGAAAALTGPQHIVHEFCSAFERRRNIVVNKVATISGLALNPPAGAFYAFIDCSALIGAKLSSGDMLANDSDVTRYLLQHAGVAAVPGAAYGLSPFFRISTAASEGVLADALNRIAVAVQRLAI